MLLDVINIRRFTKSRESQFQQEPRNGKQNYYHNPISFRSSFYLASTKIVLDTTANWHTKTWTPRPTITMSQQRATSKLGLTSETSAFEGVNISKSKWLLAKWTEPKNLLLSWYWFKVCVDEIHWFRHGIASFVERHIHTFRRIRQPSKYMWIYWSQT